MNGAILRRTNLMLRTSEAISSSIFGFFGLRENPFSISPNPRFLCLTPLMQAASQQLVGGILKRKGLILLTGEVGTGKTLLLQRLLSWLTQQNMPTALINNSRLNSDQLLDLILSDFGVPCKSSIKSDKLLALNRWLVDRYRRGQIPVLIVDEAQGLPLTTLEEIRLLMNLETPSEKLLQVVLAGQPELEDKLKLHGLRQLRQRVAVRCGTAPLTLEETQSYIHNRLRTAGAKALIFDSQAIVFVHAYSRGIPRVINLLCEHSLINAYADDSHAVYPRFVESAARDCNLDQVESITCALSSDDAPVGALADINAMFTAISMLADSGPARELRSVGSAVLTESVPASASQVCVQRSALRACSAELVSPSASRSADPRPHGERRVSSSVPVSPAQRKPDSARQPRAAADGFVRPWPIPFTSRVRNLVLRRWLPAFSSYARRSRVRPWPSASPSRARTSAAMRSFLARLTDAAALSHLCTSAMNLSCAARKRTAGLSRAAALLHLRTSAVTLIRATASLFQGWCSGFSADARASWRQLLRQLRRTALPPQAKPLR
jgi:general secretion pathway protein A